MTPSDSTAPSHDRTAESGTSPGTATWRSTFSVPGMDCPSEERLIRMALQDLPGLEALQVDLAQRTVQAWHEGPPDALLARLQPLGLGVALTGSVAARPAGGDRPGERQEARTLRLLLAINALMFGIELVAGWKAESTGLLADALDMLADATVYGVALLAVGGAAAAKRHSARVAGGLQMALAIGLLIEVARRFALGSEPVSALMMAVSSLALVANLACLWLLSPQRDRGIHLKASWIFSANDVLANIGVLAAGALVALTGSPWPDLVIGAVIGVVVLAGARRILALARS